MGWLYLHRSKGQTDKEFFTKQWNNPKIEILETGRHRGTIYMAVRVMPEDYTFAMAVLYQIANDHHNFGYKTIDEFAGPVSATCPTKILKMLTPLNEIAKHDVVSPTNVEWAKAWREDCWDFRNRLDSLPKVKPGMRLRFDEPIRLTNGDKVQEFTYLKNNRAEYDNGRLMRLSRDWKERYDFTRV